MAVVGNESDQRHKSRSAPFRVAAPVAPPGGDPADGPSGASRTAVIGAIRARAPRPAPPPFRAGEHDVPQPERGDVPGTQNGRARPDDASEPVDQSEVWARHDLMRSARVRQRTQPEPVPDQVLVEVEPVPDHRGSPAEPDVSLEPDAGQPEDEAAAAPPEADDGDRVARPDGAPAEVVDPYLKPAIEAAAAARAAAARIRENTRIWADVTIRPRYEPPVGLPLAAVMERRAIVFHPLRRATSPLPYRTDDVRVAQPASHLTIPPYARHQPLRLDEPARAATDEDEPEARSSGDDRFTRFRAEVEMTSHQVDEDPDHPWASQVPVPITQTAPRRSLWSRLSRLFGGSDDRQETT